MANTVKVEIKSRWDGAVLFAVDIDASVGESLRLKAAVVLAVKSGADLGGAYLGGAYLRGAYLGGAYLGGADLRGAYLGGADLRGADLRGAKVDGFTLVGERPVLQLGPLGSRADYLLAFLTEQGVRIRAGCFTGTLAEFSEVVQTNHADNEHGREYAAAIALIEAHAAVWTPVIEEVKAAA